MGILFRDDYCKQVCAYKSTYYPRLMFVRGQISMRSDSVCWSMCIQSAVSSEYLDTDMSFVSLKDVRSWLATEAPKKYLVNLLYDLANSRALSRLKKILAESESLSWDDFLEFEYGSKSIPKDQIVSIIRDWFNFKECIEAL